MDWRLLAPALTLAAAVQAAEPGLPRRDLQVEWREADAAQSGGTSWDVRSTDAVAARERPPQRLRVANGATVSLNLTLTRPLQVWQAVPTVLGPLPAAGTVWIEAGQHLSLQPRWPGRDAPVTVSVRAGASRLDPSIAPGSAELPARAGGSLLTTVNAPLGRWVTVAASGENDDAFTVLSSGQASAAAQRVLQLRVSLVP